MGEIGSSPNSQLGRACGKGPCTSPRPAHRPYSDTTSGGEVRCHAHRDPDSSRGLGPGGSATGYSGDRRGELVADHHGTCPDAYRDQLCSGCRRRPLCHQRCGSLHGRPHPHANGHAKAGGDHEIVAGCRLGGRALACSRGCRRRLRRRLVDHDPSDGPPPSSPVLGVAKPSPLAGPPRAAQGRLSPRPGVRDAALAAL
jgi:hypothetical protein